MSNDDLRFPEGKPPTPHLAVSLDGPPIPPHLERWARHMTGWPRVFGMEFGDKITITVGTTVSGPAKTFVYELKQLSLEDYSDAPIPEEL